ncbi:DUF2892 domain-containing protein [Alicyclobacillus sp. SO9]|uniref:YgaP family membrane protein n=1 Tax=Alicyclobacillus sp. SO9 TaxID=2665646 RepID=UPI00351C7AFA
MQNIGPVDRVIRIILGIALLALFLLHGPVRYWGLIGLIPLVTAIIGFCPLYRLFGIRTLRR